jgi:hypothetical protein
MTCNLLGRMKSNMFMCSMLLSSPLVTLAISPLNLRGGNINKVGDIRLQERYTIPAAPNVINLKNEER